MANANANHVLVVDDDPAIRSVVRAHLTNAGYRVSDAAEATAALTLLETETPDIILLDLAMPGMSGFALCREIRHHPRAFRVPILILTAHGGESSVIEGLDAGADDFLTKPFAPRELIARIDAKIRRITTDGSISPLTRLPGNIAIESEIRGRLAAGTSWAVLHADLDNFKAFNDAYGFVRGDDAIRLVGTILQTALHTDGRHDDFLGHIGGDDFIAVTSAETGEAVARAAAAAFDRAAPSLYDAIDRERGYIETRGRLGLSARFPIMSLSIAVVSGADRPLTNYGQIGEIAAELKSFAKKQPGSFVATEKRRS